MEERKFKCYKCFSNNLKEFLMGRGLEYITIALDPKSHKTFWMFLRCDELDKALTEWSEGKPSRV